MVLKKAMVLAAATALLMGCETGPKSQGNVSGGGSAGGGASGGWVATAQRCGGERVFFDFDQYDLEPAARRTVECWANYLKDKPGVTVLVEGNADERGTREYNLALGDRRANAVKNYLVALGVNARRVRTISYGKERPWVPGANEAAWAKNRNSKAVPSGPGS
ncbi:MAG: peptidoglycan-associated lipoprotein Pal [Alphaproteobacteria bacterium]|jgi:peptidoglycan-associated lipoprotein